MTKVNWDIVDWSLNNGELSRLYNVDQTSVWQARKKRGIPPATTSGKPRVRCTTNYLYSSTANPLIDLDKEFAFSIDKAGRKKPSNSWNKTMLNFYGPECKLCRYHKEPVKNHCHHVIPISEGGKNTLRNGIILCSRCHDEVHANILVIPERNFDDFRPYRLFGDPKKGPQ